MSPTPMMLCDSHIHLFSNGFVGTAGRSPAGADEELHYESLRIIHGIGLAVVVGYEGEVRYRGNNAFILARAAEQPWIRPLAYVGTATTASQVADALARGFVGVSVYATHADGADNVRDLLARIAPPLIERKALLSVNVIPELYAVIASTIAAWPELRILISHLGLPATGGQDSQRTWGALHALGHLSGLHTYVKASAFYTLESTVAAEDALGSVLGVFGPSRVVWGSDYPPVLDHQSFARAVDGPWRSVLPADAMFAVMGGTMRGLLAEVQR